MNEFKRDFPVGQLKKQLLHVKHEFIVPFCDIAIIKRLLVMPIKIFERFVSKGGKMPFFLPLK